MRTREEQIEEIKERVEDLSLVNCYPEFSEIQDWLIEAERRAEQRVRAEMSVGYIFHNPDTGTEILPYHPVESGECLDAQDIRQATAEALREELVSTWEEMANEHREREKRGEESRKDSERLDWFEDNCSGVKYQWDDRRRVGEWQITYGEWSPTIRSTIDAARENAND